MQPDQNPEPALFADNVVEVDDDDDHGLLQGSVSDVSQTCSELNARCGGHSDIENDQLWNRVFPLALIVPGVS